jgi:hypothetical protein
MDWNCTLTEERLSDFLDGTLLPEEAAAFSAHSAACADCTKLRAQVAGLVTRIQQAPALAEPAHLQRKILDATLGPQKQEAASRGPLGWLSFIWQPRFAMGIVTVAASFAIVFHAAASQSARGNLNPLNLLRGANRQIHLTYARGARFVNNLRVVYEIQSRLSPPPESLSEPVTPPPARPAIQSPGEQEHDTAPREKSQTVPHSTRSRVRSGPELADAIPPSSFSSISFPPATRSLL